MHEEACVGNGSHPSVTHAGELRLNHKNNDETSIKGNELFCFINVFHVQDKAFPVVLHFKENLTYCCWE